MRYAVCHILPFFNLGICFSYCSRTCSQEHGVKCSGQAKNKQVGRSQVYISNRSTQQTDTAFGCQEGPQQLCEGAAADLPGLFWRGSKHESLWLENCSQPSDMRACSHLRCSSAVALGEFEPNSSPHSLASTIDQLSYFNKLSLFLIVSSLFMRRVIQHSFAGKRQDLSIPPSK